MISVSSSQIRQMEILQNESFRERAVKFARQTVDKVAGAETLFLEDQFDRVSANLKVRDIRTERSVMEIYLEVLRHEFKILTEHKNARYLDDVAVSEFVRVRKFLSEFYDV